MICYAHRGASHYAPENTKIAFDLGVSMGANGIETDVQLTKDGVPVLFHDNKIDKKSNSSGAISDFTLKELKALDFGIWFDPRFSGEKILTFSEFCELYFHFDLTFAIELKCLGAEEKVAEIIDKYDNYDKIYITSFSFEAIEKFKKIRPNARVGWLVDDNATTENIAKLKAINGDQICPKAEFTTKDGIALARSEGLSVRLWGIDSPDRMKFALSLDIDGMTVNHPDIMLGYN